MAEPQRPNVLLLVLDALRADAIEPYGAPVGSSPALAGLARRGIAVADVRSTASWTLPSHIAMFTGELARGLGLGQAPEQTPQSAAPIVRAQRERLLAEVLRRAGYVTKGVTTNVWAGTRTGFDTGFDEFLELDSSRQNALGRGPVHRLKWDWEGALARGDDGAAAAQSAIDGWMGDLDDRPFFWFANIVECHSPYLPPRAYDGLSLLGRLRAADEAHRYLNFDAILRTWLGALEVPEGALRRMRRLYAASVRYVDHWVGGVLGSLSAAGVLDQTLVIVCSDHGENLGEGGLLTHGLSVDDRLLRVPLVAAGPGAHELAGMTSLAQLPARLGQITGLEDHPWGQEPAAGPAIAQWDPFPLTDDKRAELIRTWGLDEAAVRRLSSPLTCAVSGDVKLVRGQDDTDEWLYDLNADPLELAPIRDESAMAARAGEMLSSLRAAVRHPRAQLRAGEAPPPDTVPIDEVADIERRLRLMGYM